MIENQLLDESTPRSRLNLQVVARELPADLETPVSAFLKLRDFGAKVLLESVEFGITLGRYSFIGFQLNHRIDIMREKTSIRSGSGTQEISHDGSNPLEHIKKMLSRLGVEPGRQMSRLLGGVVGYIGYDFIRFIENIPDGSEDNLNVPIASFYVIDTLLVFDHVRRRMVILSLTDDAPRADVQQNIDKVIERLRSPLPKIIVGRKTSPGETAVSNFTEREYCRAVEKAKEHIRAGDVFQLVLSQRYCGETEADPFHVYRALRMLNPSPYMFFLEMGDVTLVGSSPEALVSLENGRTSVHPIAGTRPRGENETEDRRLADELLADEKERAEHVMLVDLGRNDLGRCCDYGSIGVSEFMKIERYSHVMHITSHVSGALRSDLDQFDLFNATFPAGTVTGAPKIRAMELIDEMEGLKRGPYAGAVGYFSLSGDSDWCISIRTIIMTGKKYFLQAGAGIVADSVPEREFIETNNKLAALRKAITMAEEGLE